MTNLLKTLRVLFAARRLVDNLKATNQINPDHLQMLVVAVESCDDLVSSDKFKEGEIED